ncbi:MAG: DMT family transporter [Gammaproteobacteria bacterium]|nr:DMT family transporter [Gammaproteobacteria bacterium]
MSTKSENRAVLALLLSATLWGLIWYPLRLLEEGGINGLWSSLIIYGSLIPLGLWLARRHLSQVVSHPYAFLAIAISSGWCNVAFIVAVIDGHVVRVLLLFYLSPIWAILLAWWWLKEVPHRKAMLTVVVAMAGAVVMLWNPQLGMPWPETVSDGLALSAGFAFAVSNVALRASHGLNLRMKMAANWLGVSLVALSGILIFTSPLPHVPVLWYGLALLMGLVMLVMTLTVQYGVTHLAVYRSSVILLFELVAGAVSAQLLTHERISVMEWMGGGLIILAAYLSSRTQEDEGGDV